MVLERTPGPPADIARMLRALAGDASRRERGPPTKISASYPELLIRLCIHLVSVYPVVVSLYDMPNL
jgi:hypothetical protein